MRNASRSEYLRRIDRVVERVSASIAGGEPAPSIETLARHASLSEYHFMRVYRALAGEALGATIQRLRLQRALHLLTQTAAPIAEIAGRVGYETPQAFAKAFRKFFGVAPSEARERPAMYASAFAPRPVDSPPPVIHVEVVELQPFRVAALRNHGAYADLDQAYSKLFEWMIARGALDSMHGIWGAPHHDRRDCLGETCVFDCYLATSAQLADGDGVRIAQIGGGRFATYRHVGSYELLDDAHDALLRDALPARGLTLRDAPILHQFLNDPEITPAAALETVIHVPVE